MKKTRAGIKRTRIGGSARRAVVLAVVAAFGVGLYLAALGFASSSPPIKPKTSSPPYAYADLNYTISQGQAVQFQNPFYVGHDVTADAIGPDGLPVFQADTTIYKTNPVRGTQYLTTGDYQFHCSIHDVMHATLHVTSAGAPVPRPSATVSILSSNLTKARKRGKLAFRITSTAAGAAYLTVRIGNTNLRTREVEVAAGSPTSFTVPVRASLLQSRKVRIVARAAPRFGTAATASRTLIAPKPKAKRKR